MKAVVPTSLVRLEKSGGPDKLVNIIVGFKFCHDSTTFFESLCKKVKLEHCGWQVPKIFSSLSMPAVPCQY